MLRRLRARGRLRARHRPAGRCFGGRRGGYRHRRRGAPGDRRAVEFLNDLLRGKDVSGLQKIARVLEKQFLVPGAYHIPIASRLDPDLRIGVVVLDRIELGKRGQEHDQLVGGKLANFVGTVILNGGARIGG